MDDTEIPTSPRKKLKFEQPEVTLVREDIKPQAPVSDRGSNTQVNTDSVMAVDSQNITAVSEGSAKNANINHSHKLSGPAPAVSHLDATSANDLQYVTKDQFHKENVCGITEFVSPDLLGFTGLLKKRYTDFLVNEILPSGEVIHLTNLKSPKDESQNSQKSSKINKSLRNEEAKPNDSQLNTEQGVKSAPEEAAKAPALRDESLGTHHATNLSDSAKLDASSSSHTNASASIKATVDEADKISPHKRIPQSNSIPLSMRDFDNPSPTKKAEDFPRKKDTVLIRQTSEGWVEVDEQKEKEMEKKSSAELQDDGTTQEKTEQEHGPKDKVCGEQGGLPDEDKVSYTPQPSTQASWQAFAGIESADAGVQLKTEDKNTLLSYFSNDTVDSILDLYNRIINSPHRKSKDYGMVQSAVIDRQTRSKIHQDIRRIFNSRLESTTDNDGALMITAMAERPVFNARTPMSKNDRGRGKNHFLTGKPTWKELGGEYLHFTLFKENKDTMEAISWLAKELKMKPQSFQFAGTKDRRGVTVQRVSAYRVFDDRMAIAGRSLRNAKIGNYEYRPHPLQLGELTGNEFVITLRECDFHYPMQADTQTVVKAAESILHTAMSNLRERGFLNYYGLQRFGTFSTSTDNVGVKILQGDFKAAVEAILHFNPRLLTPDQDLSLGNDKISIEDKARASALNAFKTTGRIHPAIDNLPRKFSAEASIIRHLGKSGQGNDFLGALQSISRNLRLMYVHAYQSLVWNITASERWKRFGNAIIEGDLVLVDEHPDQSGHAMEREDVDLDGEAVVHAAADDRAINAEDIFVRARALTKDEAESGKFSIFDIVLPTPGYDILYPSNTIGNFYEEFMASERGGGLDPYDMRRKWKDFSLSGSYRKMVARPGKDLSFEIKTYRMHDEQFVVTDVDRMFPSKSKQQGRERHQQPPQAQGDHAQAKDFEDEQGNVEGDKKDESKGDDVTYSDSEHGGVGLDGTYHPDFKLAVILKLQLGSSQYATMALRELMKLGGVKTYKPDFGGGR